MTTPSGSCCCCSSRALWPPLRTVEPVFANLRHNNRLDRFTLRGREKVDGQWKLCCLVHNTDTLAHAGYSA